MKINKKTFQKYFWVILCLFFSGCTTLASSVKKAGSEVTNSNKDYFLNDSKILNEEEIVLEEEIYRKVEDFLEKGKKEFQKENYAEAIQLWRKVLVLIPKYKEAELLITSAEKLLWELKAKEEEMAKRKKEQKEKTKKLRGKIEILKRSLEEVENRKKGEDILLKGANYYYRGEYEKALLTFKRGLMLSPDSEKLKNAVIKVKKRLAKITKKKEVERAIAAKLRKSKMDEEEKRRLAIEEQERKKISKGEKVVSEEEDEEAMLERYWKNRLEEEFIFETLPKEMTKGMKEEFLVEKSIEVYREAIKRYPLHPMAAQAQYRVAIYNFNKKLYDVAQIEFQKILKNYFDSEYSEEALLKIAYIDVLKGNINEAISNYYKFIDTFPHSANRKEAYLGLVDLYYQQKKYDRAAKIFQEIRDFVREEAPLIEVDFREAELFIKQEKLTEAIKKYTEIMEKNRETKYYDKAQLARADCYHLQKDYRKAKMEYIDIINSYVLNPYAFDAYMKLSEIFRLEKNYLKAVELYNKMISKFPFEEEIQSIYLKKAQTYKEAGLYDKATDAFNNILEFYSDDKVKNPVIFFEMADCYMQRKDFKKAEEYLKKIVIDEFAKEDLKIKVLLVLGEVLFKAGDYKKALEAYHDVVDRIKDKVVQRKIFLNIAKCYKTLENLDKAFIYYEKTYHAPYKQEAKELVIEALLDAAEYLYQQDKYSEAINLYNRIIEEFPERGENVWPLYQIGRSYERLSRYEDAIEIYQEVIKKYKDDYLAQQALWDIESLKWYIKDKKILQESVLK